MLKSKIEEDLPGFDLDPKHNKDQDVNVTKNNKKSGAFQCMGLSFPVLKGVTKRGYKQPTPIQRKTIPLVLEGKDVVAMARTGSGKTACFVLPILESLIAPANKGGPGKNFRALILSPTRELSLQTLKFVRELGKFTGLTSAAILGGESLEQQFSVMSGTAPDIVVATPGRFLHICVEMNLQLTNIKVVVFDEADRLFELGFEEQLKEILSRLPSGRQTLLFSATMPRMLIEFARAGLSDPVLIRLDVDWKLPSTLWLGWISVRAELKTAALLLLLDKVLTTKTPQAVVFAATKHHVEYLHLILQKAGISSACAYSGLEPAARKIALSRFTSRRCAVLLVTDVAARGLDLPALDTVVNYHFPAKPKLFVHRAGRSARAGRAGRAFSLVAADDMAHLLDLQLFLGAELGEARGAPAGAACPSGVWGTAPPQALELRHQAVVAWEKDCTDVGEATRVAARGWQQYLRWREPASADANRRAKATRPPAHTHPFLREEDAPSLAAHRLLRQINDYTPKGTILELTTKNDSPMYLAMKAKRKVHEKTIEKTRENKGAEVSAWEQGNTSRTLKKGVKSKKEFTRDENYIPHQASDHAAEAGMAVNLGAADAELELGADCGEGARHRAALLRWDRKRKRMVHHDPDGGRKMIRTESGGRIPATYRSGRYEQWRRDHAPDAAPSRVSDDTAPAPAGAGTPSEFRPRWVRHNERRARAAAAAGRSPRDKHQIVKERLRRDKIKATLKHKTRLKNNKKKNKKK